MGLAEVAGHDGAVDGAHDGREGDGLRGAGQDISATDAAL